MPKYKSETAMLKAKLLVKPLLRNGFNKAALAREEGVTRQAIQERFQNLPVRKTLQAALRKIGITTKYKAKKFKELLEQKKLQDCDIFIKDQNGKIKVNRNSNNFIEVEDGFVRLGALKLLCQVEGDIKPAPVVDQSQHNHYIVFRNPAAIKEESESDISKLPAR